MLTDKKLKSLKPEGKLYKLSDRDGLYVAVSKTGVISFRYDYRFNGRRETITFGRYSDDGITLAEARNLLLDAKKLLNAGVSPASSKRDGIDSRKNGTVLKDYTVKYLADTRFANSTRAMKEAIVRKEIYPTLGKLQLEEITTQKVRPYVKRLKIAAQGQLLYRYVKSLDLYLAMSLTVAMKLKTPSTASKHLQLPPLKRASVHYLLKKLVSSSTNLKITVAIQR